MGKILCISHSSRIGGGEFVFLNVIKILHEKNQNLEIILPKSEGELYSKLSEITNIKRIKFFTLSGRGLLNLCLKLLLNFFIVIRLIVFNNFRNLEKIYSGSSINVLGIIMAILLKKEHIWHIHERFVGKRIEMVLYKNFFSYKNGKVIFISKALRLQWEKELGFKIKNSNIIINPLKKIDYIETAANKEFIFGFAGTLNENKNLFFLLDAYGKFIDKYKDKTKLIIVGNGILRHEVEDRIKKFYSVEYLGELSNMSSFYNEVDVLIVPSVTESFSLVAAEAMSLGKVIIINENIGIEELIVNEENGLIYNSGQEESLIYYMEKILNSKELYDKISSNSIKTIRERMNFKIFKNEINKLF